MKRTVFEPVSTPLESKIAVKFNVVGTQEWFDTAFEEDAVLEEEKIVISEDKAELKSIVAQARSMKLIGVDTETTGDYQVENKEYTLNPVNKGTRIVLLQLGNEDQVWLIDPDLIEDFREVLENDDQLHLAHNWEFDFKWLLVKYKIHPRRLYCSMLAEQLLTAGLLGYKVGLADCARRYEPNNIVSKAVRSMFTRLGDGRMTRDMVKYAARDIPLLFPVFRGQSEKLIEKKLGYVANLEFDNIQVAAEMETQGYYVDQGKLNLLIRYWKQRQLALEEQILELYSKREGSARELSFFPDWSKGFDLKSNKDKHEALKRIGVELNDVKKNSLLATGDEIAILMAEYSHVLKMISTYGDNLLKKINKKTGRIHPRFAQMGSGSGGGDGRDTKDTTATGRWTGDAQQFPRKSDGLYAPLFEGEKEDAEAYFAEEIAKAKAKYEQREKTADATLPIPVSTVDGPS